MNSHAIEQTARTAFLQFLLEVSYKQFAEHDKEAFNRSRDNVLNSVRFNLLVTGGSGDDDIDLAVQNKMIEIAEQFFARIETRLKVEESRQKAQDDQPDT